MKKIYLTIIIAVISIVSYGQNKNNDYFYFYQGKKMFLKASTEKIFVRFLSDSVERKDIFDSLDSRIKPLEDENTYGNIVIYELQKGISTDTVDKIITTMQNENSNTIISKAYSLSNGSYNDFLTLSGEIIVRLKNSTSKAVFKSLLEEYNISIKSKGQYTPERIVLKPDNNRINTLSLANEFYETGLFEYSEPNWMFRIRQQCADDEYFDDQWGLKNTGQDTGTSGIDINACDAWDSSSGSGVKVAVIDNGVDLTHPDLSLNIISGYDATGDQNGGAAEGDDWHGTACAGVIGALSGTNLPPYEGIAGVAPGAAIMPVRIADQNYWASNEDIAGAIDWAVNHDAEVLSNSWSGDTPSDAIYDAIENALTNGRDGKGCVVVFAAGNNDTIVKWPASAHPDIIAVGAIDRCGIRSGRIDVVTNSCDPWSQGASPGSCYGDKLDVVAPGTSVPTTDLQGSAGKTSSDYYFRPLGKA